MAESPAAYAAFGPSFFQRGHSCEPRRHPDGAVACFTIASRLGAVWIHNSPFSTVPAFLFLYRHKIFTLDGRGPSWMLYSNDLWPVVGRACVHSMCICCAPPTARLRQGPGQQLGQAISAGQCCCFCAGTVLVLCLGGRWPPPLSGNASPPRVLAASQLRLQLRAYRFLTNISLHRALMTNPI